MVEVERTGGMLEFAEQLGNEVAVMPAILLPIVEFDRAVAERRAVLFADLAKRGEMIPANDI